MEKIDLSKLPMAKFSKTRTAAEYLETVPEKWRKENEEAIYECLRRGWPVHVGHILMICRELDAKRRGIEY